MAIDFENMTRSQRREKACLGEAHAFPMSLSRRNSLLRGGTSRESAGCDETTHPHQERPPPKERMGGQSSLVTLHNSLVSTVISHMENIKHEHDACSYLPLDETLPLFSLPEMVDWLGTIW